MADANHPGLGIGRSCAQSVARDTLVGVELPKPGFDVDGDEFPPVLRLDKRPNISIVNLATAA
jgi:hypothetical protein